MSDMKFWDVFRDPLWLLYNFMNKYKWIRVPTRPVWDTINVLSGVVYGSVLSIYARTGVTANSTGLGYASTYGLNSGNLSLSGAYVDWTKRLELSFWVGRLNSDSECIARFQLKETPFEGILAQRGIGVSIANYVMVGEAYGTARSTVALGTLTDNRLVRIRIVCDVNRVEFWVNGVLTGTLTGTAVPNVVGTAGGALVISIINGATGGVDAALYVGDIQIVQKW